MTERRTVLGLAALGVGSFLIPAPSAYAAADCASPGGAAANSALLDRYVAAVNAHDTSSFADIFTDTYLQRSGRSPPGLAAQIENAARFFTALPDLHLIVEDRIFSGDRIVARCTYTGTQSGKLVGVERPANRSSLALSTSGASRAESWPNIGTRSTSQES